jgi:hypothetical protein
MIGIAARREANSMKARDLSSGPPTFRGTARSRPVLLALFAAIFIAVPAVAQDTGAARAEGFPTDWSHNHLIFTDGGAIQAQLNARQDPRAQMQWMRENLPLLRQRLPQIATDRGNPTGPGGEVEPDLRLRPRPPVHLPKRALRGDWNFSLQTDADDSGVGPTRYPAKYTFAPRRTANCTTDFVVYGLNVKGNARQANLIGINNLYVGTTGLCDTIDNGGGNGPVPTPAVQWAYFDAAGAITSSIVLNLEGTKVAYIANSSPATLRVLTLGAGTGTVTAPTDVTSATLASVTLSGRVTNSSIFVDYKNDIGWVSDDNGQLYRVGAIFNGTPALDLTLNPDPTRCNGRNDIMTAPVYDSGTDTVFVACRGGFLYGYTTASGTPVLMADSLQLADTNPGIVAPPIVDSTNHILYAFYGEDVATGLGQVSQVVYTATPTFSTNATASLGTAGTNRVSFASANDNLDVVATGAFSHSYFSDFSPATSFLYVCGPNAATNPVGIALQQLSFDANRILSGAITKVAILSSDLNPNNTEYCSPLTHFYNANTATDYLFLSVPPLFAANVLSFDITSNTAGGALSPSATATADGGTSGIIVDGIDPANQASSLYFTSLSRLPGACSISAGIPAGNVATPANTGIGNVANAICAFKLTQNGLE